MPNRPQRRTRLAALTLILLVVGATVACSSDREGSDPTTTIATASSGSSTPEDEDDEGGSGTSTTIDEEPRTGTSLAGGTEEPPTGDETEADYADALIASFEEDPDEIFTVADIECIAPKWVAAIGVEAFQAAGITPVDIEAGESGIQDVVIDRDGAEGIVDSIPECGLDLMTLFIDGLPSSVKDDPAVVACIEGKVTEDQVRDALIAEIMGAEGEDPEDLAGECIV